MKRIIVFVAFAILVSGPSFAEAREDRLDQIPSMSGKIEIMEELGLIDHSDDFKPARSRRSQNPRKGTSKNVLINNLADISSAGD